MDAYSAMEQVFRNLDQWRNLPKYQLERRADIFFSLYIRNILQSHFNTDIVDAIIPEFPLNDCEETKRTVNVDYVLFSADGKTVYLVELKTDAASINDKQDKYLEKAAGKEFEKILSELVSVFAATSAKQKYYHLFSVLHRLNLIEIDDIGALGTKLYPNIMPGVSKLINQIKPAKSLPDQIIVVYIEPRKMDKGSIRSKDTHSIGFKEIREKHLAGLTDDFTRLFCDSLKKWETDAGAAIPAEQV